MPNYGLVAANAYNIFRGSQRGENEKLFPHRWDGLPQHYRDLLTYVAEFSRVSQVSPMFECPECGKDVADADTAHGAECPHRAN